jgi:3-oxoacyl-[acyl-carrier protein] reductase
VVLNNIAESEELAAAGAKLAAQRADGVAISVGDVGDPEAAKQIVRTAFNRWKRLDILVNNAGILRDNLIGMIPDEDIHSVLATNLVGVIATIQHAARLIARNKNGSIVNISSIIGVRGNRGEPRVRRVKGRRDRGDIVRREGVGSLGGARECNRPRFHRYGNDCAPQAGGEG